jgi:hypothetical protein
MVVVDAEQCPLTVCVMLERLSPLVLELVAAPRGVGVEARRVLILSPSDDVMLEAGDVALVVGSTAADGVFVDLLERAGEARVALVVDVAAARIEEEARVEQAISLGAAITDALARQDFLIDIFAAGEQVHRIQAGPAVDAMEHVLELLAGLEPGASLDPAALEALLVPELSRLSAVYFVMASWDGPRRALVQTVRELGATVRVHCVIPGLDLGLGEDEQVS